MADTNTEKSKIQKGKNDKTFNTETMLPISEIRGNTMIMKDGGLRAIIKVFGLNLDLRNYEEQQIAIEQYKRFLNGLSFPVQIVVRSTYLDLTDYIEYMTDNVNSIENDVLKWQGEQYTKFLDEINSQQGLIYTKEFYIVVPYYESEDDQKSIRKPWWKKFMEALDSNESPEKVVARFRGFVQNRKHLDTRCNVVSEGLRSMGIMTERLHLSEIISLMFKIYNPNSHKVQSEFES